ncbi:MAG: protein kinase [Acidobacteriota bacterium]
MPLAPGERLGPYEILALVGKGGMGEVYRAHDDRLRRDVAIKVSNAEFSERFTREARAVASLNHSNICHLYDVGPNYLVMEFVEGEDLTSAITAGPMSLDEALPVIRQLIDGIEAAHEKNIIHRDLKPANIKITHDGVVKILDFGLAKASDLSSAGDPSQSPTVTMGATVAGTILGTAAYMSPEQAKGKQVDKRADIFSFGVVLYELLTGQNPFKGETVVESLGAILNKDPDWTSVPARTERLLRWCLQKDRKSRLASISDARILLEEPVVANAVEPVTVVQKQPTSKLPWLVTAAALIGAAALAFWPQPAPALHALRYTIDPPPGFQFTNTNGAGTPSPDGRFIVFGAVAVGSTAGKNAAGQSLWLRPSDSLEARPLPGTQDSNFPFWSPDGKSIGFYAVSERKLKRVEAVGGAPQVVCDVVNFEGGTWSQDGVILFSAGNLIQRVAAAGGKPEPVTKPAGEQSHRDPQFLPDGQSFLYRVVSRDEKVSGIYAATLAKPDPPVRLVTGTDRKAVYAPPFASSPGYLLWMRDQTLVAQRFDPSALKLQGDPLPVAEDVAMQAPRNNARRAAFWISQNGLLAYRTGAATNSTIQMTWISRDGKQRDPVAKADDFGSDFRLSPDGKHVALSRTVSGNKDIWLYEFERGVLSRLTFDAAPDEFPVWSPDSRQLAFASQRGGLYQLFRKDAGGAGQEERLHESAVAERPMDWSRDGKFLLYSADDPKTLADAWALPMDGTSPRKPVVVHQTPFREGIGRISPDGKWVAYQSDESGTSQIYIRAMPGGPAGQWQVSNAVAQQPRWRGDGKELFYFAPAVAAEMAAGIKLLADRVDIETPRELFRSRGFASAYHEPTPDGQRVLVLVPPFADESDPGAGALNIVSNWQALLK